VLVSEAESTTYEDQPGLCYAAPVGDMQHAVLHKLVVRLLFLAPSTRRIRDSQRLARVTPRGGAVAAPASAQLRTFFGFVAVRRAACVYSPSGMNSTSNSGIVRAKLSGMLVPDLSNASRWQQPNPALKRTCLRHAA
jgi:hypothetical protein